MRKRRLNDLAGSLSSKRAVRENCLEVQAHWCSSGSIHPLSSFTSAGAERRVLRKNKNSRASRSLRTGSGGFLVSPTIARPNIFQPLRRTSTLRAEDEKIQ